MNDKDPNIKLTYETGDNINYLDVRIIKDSDKKRFSTTVYRKPAAQPYVFSFESSHPLHIKQNIVYPFSELLEFAPIYFAYQIIILLIDGGAVNITSCTLNSNELLDDVDNDVNRLVKKLTDDALDTVCNSILDLSSNFHSDVLSQASLSSIDFNLPSSSNILLGLQSPPQHDARRKRATDSYLNIVNKERKGYDAHLKSKSVLLNINNCVEREKDDMTFKLVCKFGKLQNSYTVQNRIDLKEACQADLKAIDV
ncbi:unnamed protein product [Didymodactylos carnosus]|uniref:Uncharacterized protein n=1 Tax=Didymodactylos carnosus TaxID=1234261 RepID=A0A815Q4G2_9BILA|nr:unnamed protein product [Didymodactylos carnosus]CAF4329336.1 unnamed protein product [Didymodactylos carnosus]